FELLDNSINELLAALLPPSDIVSHIDFKSIGKQASTTSSTAWNIRDRLEQLSRENEKKTPSEGPKSEYSYQQHALYSLAEYVSELADYTRSNEADLANTP